VAIDPLSTWQTTLDSLPKTEDSSWAKNFASWYYERIASIAASPSALAASGFKFTFAKAVFESKLLALTFTPSALAGISKFADAWESAIKATTVLVGPGSVKQPASGPATTFSAVSGTVIDPSSIAAGKAKIITLVSAPTVKSGKDSEFAVKFREATLLLTITATGVNSSSPSGPLVAASVPLI
jgi:hypothetical protein